MDEDDETVNLKVHSRARPCESIYSSSEMCAIVEVTASSCAWSEYWNVRLSRVVFVY